MRPALFSACSTSLRKRALARAEETGCQKAGVLRAEKKPFWHKIQARVGLKLASGSRAAGLFFQRGGPVDHQGWGRRVFFEGCINQEPLAVGRDVVAPDGANRQRARLEEWPRNAHLEVRTLTATAITLPSCRQRGSLPPTVETCHLPTSPGSGWPCGFTRKGTT